MRLITLLLTMCFASAAQADIYDDAATILNAHQGKVIKWGYAPKIAVIHDGSFDFDNLDQVLDRIDTETGLGIGASPVKSVDITKLAYPFIRGTDFRLLKGARINPRDRLGRLTLGKNPQVTADIFIFHVPILEGGYFFMLTGLSPTGAALPRRYAETGGCFFQLVGNDGRAQQARVFIGTNLDKTNQHDCIYEEVMQTMGLPKDAIGSPHFTFENEIGYVDRTNDYILLRALYDASIDHGASVNDVVKIFKRLHVQ